VGVDLFLKSIETKIIHKYKFMLELSCTNLEVVGNKIMCCLTRSIYQIIILKSEEYFLFRNLLRSL